MVLVILVVVIVGMWCSRLCDVVSGCDGQVLYRHSLQLYTSCSSRRRISTAALCSFVLFAFIEITSYINYNICVLCVYECCVCMCVGV